MYERFTDRSRKVMQLANQEAQRFNHEYIGTEHVLLGLVKEGSGIAANVLEHMDVDLRKVRLEIEKMVQAGPDMVTMGKLPHTPRSRKVIDHSIEEARSLNHSYVGTEHLLLGLLREKDGVASQVLMKLGLYLENVRGEILDLVGKSKVNGISTTKTEAMSKSIRSLNQKRDEAICNQDFETAANFRDQIKKMERKEDNHRKVVLREIISHVLEHFNNAVDLQTTLSSISDTIKEHEGK